MKGSSPVALLVTRVVESFNLLYKDPLFFRAALASWKREKTKKL